MNDPWYRLSTYGGGALTKYSQGFPIGMINVGGAALPNPGYSGNSLGVVGPVGSTNTPKFENPTSAFTVEKTPTSSESYSASLGLQAPPETVSGSASSVGGGGFGSSPDFSALGPEGLAALQSGLSNLVYSVPLGGYIFKSDQDPNSAYVKGYYGKPMTGGNPAANLAAKKLYGQIGSLPTIANVSPALKSYQQKHGVSSSQGPSYNQTLSGVGVGPYYGPWEFPGYSLNPFKT